ncbi:MAG: hypothetical protein KatS3mg016_2315 [Fimbriimonadales bacterium]|nr:MAG: hypothetical protein KatS3mg016_2315 [Fimbriimonadales bacterium]
MPTRVDDQASGLRLRTAAHRAVAIPPAPIVYADFLLFRGARVELPPSVLVWHWRPSAAPATGWDLQSRLHVVGAPTQHTLADLQRWRALFPQWRLVGRRLELLQIADVACLWLQTGVELTPRLQILLEWLWRNRPEMPIILTGIGSGGASRIQNWIEHRYPLRCLNPAQALSREALPSHGFYCLIRWAANPEAAAAHSHS